MNPMEPDAVELRVPATVEHLALVRLLVTSMAEELADLAGNRVDDLRLVVSEACANAMEAYGRNGGRDAGVIVRCRARRGCVEVEVHDEAGGFDVGAVRPPPPAETPERLHHERGLGVPLMRQLAGAEFRPEGGGTTVKLTVA